MKLTSIQDYELGWSKSLEVDGFPPEVGDYIEIGGHRYVIIEVKAVVDLTIMLDRPLETPMTVGEYLYLDGAAWDREIWQVPGGLE
jgi:hypothetical protein